MAYGSVNVPGDLSGKQDLITGVPGQVVRIGADGKAAARDGGSNPNLLLNWDFRKPVNRNGEMEYTREGYTIDLWSIESGNIKLSVENGFIRISRAISAGNPSFIQHITNSDKLNGKTVILSILYRSNCSAGFGFYINDGSNNKNAPESLGWNVVSLAVNLPEDISFLAARIPQMRASEPVGRYFDIKAVKLELGSHQTLAHQNEDGEWEIIDPPDHDLQHLLCSQYSPITGEWVGSQHSNPNLLDNWYFADPINQRREVEYIGTGYTIDRWVGYFADISIIKNSGINIERMNSTNLGTLAQHINNPKLYGKQVTFSVLLSDGNMYFGTAVIPLSWDGVSAWLTVPFFENSDIKTFAQKTVNGEFTNIVIDVIAESLTITAAKLELGPVQTLAHKEGDTWVLNDPPPDKALELAKCQRYQVETLPGTTRYGRVGTGYGYGELGAYIQCPIPVQLRAKPTVKYSGGLYLVSVNAPGTTIPISSITVDDVSTSFVTLRVISDGVTMTKGQAYELLAFNDAAAKLLLDANI